jgi:DNA-binding CsgD family transcriptional regulator
MPNELNMPNSDLELVERREKVLELRRRGFSYRRIGKALGISHETVGKHIREAIREAEDSSENSARVLRNVAHQRHEMMIARLMRVAVPADPNEPMDMDALDRVARIIAQDAKIMGYEAPTKHQVDLSVVSTSIAVVIERVVAVIPDELIPVVYDAVETGMAEVDEKQQQTLALQQ